MEIDLRQIILLAVAIAVPVLLIWTKRERLLLGWVCLTLFVQVFDTTTVTNLPAGRIVGLVYLPLIFKQLPEWVRLKPVSAWLINYAYLIALAIVFGFIWPWPDITGLRPLPLTAPGKAVIYSIRLLSDFSLTIFVANQLRRPGTIYFIGKAMALGAIMTALAGLLYFIAKVDLYNLITGLGEQGLKIERARGFSIEPRAMGLACTYGIMILLSGRKMISNLWIGMLLINIAGLMITYSTSSLALVIAGAVTAWLFFSNRERGAVFIAVLLAGFLVFGASIYLPNQFESAIETIQLRLDPDYKLSDVPRGDFGQEIAYRLDVFDASALLFLLDEPLYALIGAGPGLVPLPASYYVPPGLYSYIWNPTVGVNSPPSHGILLELTNSGLPGVILWFAQVAFCWIALRHIVLNTGDHEERAEWKFAYFLFLIGAVFYLLQVSSSPVWCVFLGIGWESCRKKVLSVEY